MAINFNQDNSGIINLSRNIDNNQMAFVPDFLKNIFTGNPEDIQLGEEGSPIDKAKDALEKRRKELERFQQGNTSSLNLPSNNLTAMAISNYDDLFSPQTFTDAFGVNRVTSGFAKPDLNTLPFNVNEVTSDGITNNNRFKNMLLDMKDKGVDMFGSGKDLVLRGIGSIVGGPVGSLIGSALGKLKTTPEQETVKGLYDLDSIGRVQSGIMQGYNPVSLFGPTGLSGAMIDRITKINKTLNNPDISKATKDVLNKRKAKIQAKIKAEQAAMRQTIEQQYRNRPGEYGGRNRQIEREQAGPGYDKLSESGSFRYGGIASL
jgi:hypothetical protein